MKATTFIHVVVFKKNTHRCAHFARHLPERARLFFLFERGEGDKNPKKPSEKWVTSPEWRLVNTNGNRLKMKSSSEPLSSVSRSFQRLSHCSSFMVVKPTSLQFRIDRDAAAELCIDTRGSVLASMHVYFCAYSRILSLELARLARCSTYLKTILVI